jgi:hypothetical protein
MITMARHEQMSNEIVDKLWTMLHNDVCTTTRTSMSYEHMALVQRVVNNLEDFDAKRKAALTLGASTDERLLA